VASLARVVSAAAKDWHGRIGNFTGGGFVVVFPVAEHAIGCVAAVIERWEPHRQAVCKALALLKAEPPDERSLMVRAGIAHGQYRFFELFSHTNVAGEAINRASRCEDASKGFFAVASLSKSLEVRQRVFVTQDVFHLIENRADYWQSKKLAGRVQGI
jgi:class 3 adenylate cyclase